MVISIGLYRTGEMKCRGVCYLWSLSWKKLLCVLVITLLSDPIKGRHLKKSNKSDLIHVL